MAVDGLANAGNLLQSAFGKPLTAVAGHQHEGYVLPLARYDNILADARGVVWRPR